ncbi:hypothetical protein ISS07_03150 [Candidatus Woesearchaeota archaeon]|nr:hypothetical protein [Candidatus Woesearchaeota archaeon]
MAEETHKSKKELFNEFDKLKNQVNSLRKDLNNINRQKEEWFSKKSETSKNIREKIGGIKKNKSERDTLTGKVKDMKQTRSSLSKKASKKLSEFQKLIQEKKEKSSKLDITDPSKIISDIKRIEFKLETEPMSFDAEKKLSKTIKDLKRSLEGASDILKVNEAITGLNKLVKSSKKDTDNVHKEIQGTAKESQKIHEAIIVESKLINNLKKEEKEALKKSFDLKKKFNSINSEIKEKLASMTKLKEHINKFQLEDQERKKLKETEFIQKKEQEFEAKIRSGKKLTTEDLLIFQHNKK